MEQALNILVNSILLESEQRFLCTLSPSMHDWRTPHLFTLHTYLSWKAFLPSTTHESVSYVIWQYAWLQMTLLDEVWHAFRYTAKLMRTPACRGEVRHFIFSAVVLLSEDANAHHCPASCPRRSGTWPRCRRLYKTVVRLCEAKFRKGKIDQWTCDSIWLVSYELLVRRATT